MHQSCSQDRYTRLIKLLGGLLRLHSTSVPAEDFFTEVIAGLFRYHPELCLAWLKNLGVLGNAAQSELVGVSTQQRLSTLESHAMGSRPDLEIRIRTPIYGMQLIFVKSKLGSAEGANQLWRYADHLRNVEDAAHKTLVYVTRDYDPKDHAEVLRSVEGVAFVQSRWSALYQDLEVYRRHLSNQDRPVI